MEGQTKPWGFRRGFNCTALISFSIWWISNNKCGLCILFNITFTPVSMSANFTFLPNIPFITQLYSFYNQLKDDEVWTSSKIKTQKLKSLKKVVGYLLIYNLHILKTLIYSISNFWFVFIHKKNWLPGCHALLQWMKNKDLKEAELIQKTKCWQHWLVAKIRT